MKTIYKYELEIIDRQTIKMPLGSQILCVQAQNNFPCIWALVNTGNSMEDVYIAIYGTGQSIMEYDKRYYIGTVQTQGGTFVWHVFKEA